MTIQLVETSEEDSFIAIASHVANVLNEGQVKTSLAETPGSKFLDECNELIAASNFEGYLSKVQQHLDLVFSKCDGKECECVANILVHAVTRLAPEKVTSAAKSLAAAFSSKLDDRAEERLGGILNLYGATQLPACQMAMLATAAEFARKSSRLAAILVPAVRGRSDDWVRVWSLDDTQARELYLSLAALVKMGSDKSSVKEYLKLMTSALLLVKEGDASGLAALKPHAEAAIKDFIRNSAIYQADFADAPAVRQLASDKALSGLYSLFTAVLSGNMPAFKSAATPAVLEQAGVTQDAAIAKARMVALLALCGKAAHEEVKFDDIQSALDIPADQVENWIVKAIGAKLLEGKIDQVRSVVSISRCTQRTFGNAEWQDLRGQLASWRDSLSSVIQNMAAQKVSTVARGLQAIKV